MAQHLVQRASRIVRRPITALAVAAAFLAPSVEGCASGAGAAATPSSPREAPVVPFNSNFWSYWTHYWATWLPDHPVYEMIELTAYENPKDPSDVLVRVFLTERAGRKRQFYYLNDEGEVRRSRAAAHFREIAYRRSGPAGGPQNLQVSFTDKDGVPIEWSIAFDPSARMRDHGAGLTPSIHSLGGILLFALRTRTVDTHDDRAVFAGVDYAHKGGPEDRAPGTRSWFNPDYYSAVLVFGRTGFTVKDGALANSWGRTFQPTPRNPRTYRTSALGRPDNFIVFDTDAKGGIRRYSHFSRGRSLDFRFKPAIPSLAHARDGQVVRFDASFDGRRPLMSGEVRVRRPGPDGMVLEWSPTGPAWALGRDFWSVVRAQDAGYEVTSTADRAAVPASGRAKPAPPPPGTSAR